MKRVISKIGTVKKYLLSKETKRGLLAVLVLVILDVAIAVVDAVYMRGLLAVLVRAILEVAIVVVDAVSSQFVLRVLSDVLFLEGALAFAVGSFLALAGAGRKGKGTEEEADKPSDERAEEYLTKIPTSKKMPFGPLLMLLGAILIALSVITGLVLV